MQQRSGWNYGKKLTSILKFIETHLFSVCMQKCFPNINHFSWNATHRECQADKQRHRLDENVHSQKWASYCFRRWFKWVMETCTLNQMGIVWWSFEGWICVVSHTKVLHLMYSTSINWWWSCDIWYCDISCKEKQFSSSPAVMCFKLQ